MTSKEQIEVLENFAGYVLLKAAVQRQPINSDAAMLLSEQHCKFLPHDQDVLDVMQKLYRILHLDPQLEYEFHRD